MKPKQLLWFIPVLLVAGYAAGLYWLSENETSMVYPLSKEMQPLAYGVTATPVVLLTNDGMRLSAWAMPDTVHAATKIWILYFHGNGGNISTRTQFYSKLIAQHFNVLAVDYRGYGQSEGDPGETGLYLDANAGYEYLVRNLGVPERHIVLYGHSLGAAVAINLGTYTEAGGIVIEGGFTSLVDRAQETYPIFPVRRIMRNRFESLTRIVQVTMPKLFIYATDDDVVPIGHGRRLFDKAPEPKRFLEVHDGHNAAFIVDQREFMRGLAGFVHEVTSVVPVKTGSDTLRTSPVF